MSDKKVPDDAEPHPETGILRQIDLFFGRKHRFHYLWVGFAAGLAVFWLAQTQIFNPSSTVAFQGMTSRITWEISQLKEDNAACEDRLDVLLDSIDQINSYGIHLGTFEVVGRDVVFMAGGMVKVERWELKNLYVEVDSTARYLEGEGSSVLYDFRMLPIGEGVVNPIFHGSLRLNLICREVTDSTVVIDVYERK